MVLEQRRVILSPREPLLYGRWIHDWSKRPFSQLYGRWIHDWSKRPFSQEVPARGTGLVLGTARRALERGMGRPLTDVERAARHKRIFGQESIRETIVDWLKTRPLLVQRSRLAEQFFPSDTGISIDLEPYTYTKTIGEISVTQD